MPQEFDDTTQHKLTSNGRVFIVGISERQATFEILTFEECDDEELSLVCLDSRRMYHMTHAEAETLAADLLNAVAEARASRSLLPSPPQS